MKNIIKYDLLNNYKTYFLGYLIFLIVCLVLPFSDNGFDRILYVSLWGIVTTYVSILVFMNIIMIFSKYQKSMYSKEGYLTQTLPVSTMEIILGKAIASTIWLIVTGIVVLIAFGYIAIMTAVRTGVDLQMLWFEIGRALSEILPHINAGLVILYFFGFILGLFTMVLGCFATVTMVQTRYTRTHRTLWMILIIIVYSWLTFTISIYLPNSLMSDTSFIFAGTRVGFDYQPTNFLLQSQIFAIAVSLCKCCIFSGIIYYVHEKLLEIE